uniref:Uncharacterized protein n=1 Tax=Cajanus cajan TaxID=3821 RepID=A0A151R5T2_CAJCA|nr:hypothetical protein KK1_040811 [Cajanus cajan]
MQLNQTHKFTPRVLVDKETNKVMYAEGGKDFVDHLDKKYLWTPTCKEMLLQTRKSTLSVDLLHEIGVKDMEPIEEKNVEISAKEVLDLLKFSLLSKTPLTDLITKKQFLYFNTKDQSQFEIGEVALNESRKTVVKVFVRPILHNGETNAPVDVVNPMSSGGKSSSCGFSKGLAMYMVTDDLVVTPISSISAVSYFNKSKVGILDLEHRVINIGLKEVKCFSETCLNFSYSTCTIAYIIYYRMKIIDSTMLHDPLCGRQDAHCRVPPTGHIKLNGDGAVSNDGIGACGGAVRDSSSRLLITRKWRFCDNYMTYIVRVRIATKTSLRRFTNCHRNVCHE